MTDALASPSLRPQVAEAFAAACRAADAARPAALAHFRAEGLSAENKDARGGFDPVTAADRGVEAAIREVLAHERPADGVLGEEQAARPWGDGDSAWWAKDGEAPRRMRARRGVALAEARLCSTFPEVGTEDERLAFERVRDRARLTRYGLDCTGYALLAAGGVDLVVEAGLHAYDVQALIPIVEGAGGVITTWDGGDPQDGGRVLAAGSPELHAEARALLSA